jgi:hypothetical protein
MAAAVESGGYREKYTTYAARYGSAERSVKRWVSLGKKNGDPCPLDDPAGVRDWWGRNMKHRVPAEILAACALAGDLLELPKVQPKPPPAEPVPPVRRELEELGADDRGIAQELRRAEERAYHAHQAWLEAMKSQNEDKIAFCNRQCATAAENVRKIQKDATDEAIRLRNYIPRLEAEQVVGEFGQELFSRVRGMGEGVARALGVGWDAAMEARWSAEVDLLCEGLQREIFTQEEPA